LLVVKAQLVLRDHKENLDLKVLLVYLVQQDLLAKSVTLVMPDPMGTSENVDLEVPEVHLDLRVTEDLQDPLVWLVTLVWMVFQVSEGHQEKTVKMADLDYVVK
jgi:hypothetical protein